MRAPTMAKWGAAALAAALLVYATSEPETSAALPVAAAPAPAYSEPIAFVKSMQGTRPDGDVRASPAGALVVDVELGHLFDYYLAGLGEKDLAAIRSEIERELERRLTPAAALQAKRLLASYLDYKQALVELEGTLKPGASLAQSARARLVAQQQLRARFFSPADSVGLFGASDAYNLDALARLEVHEDSALTAAQKTARLDALDQRMAPAMLADREAPRQIIALEESVQKLRASGAGDDDVYRLRAAAFSPEAAGRLAQLDREEAAWHARIKAYQLARSQVPAPAAAAGAAAGAAALLQQLRERHFNANEQRRLGAYE